MREWNTSHMVINDSHGYKWLRRRDSSALTKESHLFRPHPCGEVIKGMGYKKVIFFSFSSLYGVCFPSHYEWWVTACKLCWSEQTWAYSAIVFLSMCKGEQPCCDWDAISKIVSHGSFTAWRRRWWIQCSSDRVSVPILSYNGSFLWYHK